MKKKVIPVKDKRRFYHTLFLLNGFSLVEVLVAALILSVAASGLFASFIAAQKYVIRSRHRLTAANAARMVLEDFKNHVDQNTWDDPVKNPLACATYPCTKTYVLPPEFIGTPFNWRASYVITPIDVGGITMRRVDVTIHWDEPHS